MFPKMGGTDLVILATALADPDSVRLLTTDGALLENDAIVAYERELHRHERRNARLLITDTL